MIELRDVDLNLLLVFREILRARSVSGAARQLDLTQSAVSNALNRLRKTFRDELFVRTAQGMEATAFAQRLAEPVAMALDALDGAFNKSDHFDASESERHFKLLMTDVGEVYLMPKLINHCLRAAPRIGLSTVRAGTVDMQAELAAGRIDLAIGAFEAVTGSLFRRRLFEQNYLTVFRKGHPLGAGKPTLEAFRAARHLIIDNPARPYREINALLEKAGVVDSSTYRVPHFVAVPYIVGQTDLVVTVPRKLAQRATQAFGLGSVQPPWRLPTLRTDVIWHRRSSNDTGIVWLRELIADLFFEAPSR
jgi:DNA-binding transcriptional LysR family regulator